MRNHKPKFNWTTGPNAEKWICDGQMPVAEFFAGYSGRQSMSGIARPISLHNLRLTPGGPVFIARGEV